MPKSLELPFYTISAKTLAEWLDDQPEAWWLVDGDPVLTSHVDFPCPSDELSAELRRVGKSLRMFDPRKNSRATGGRVSIKMLRELADTNNNSKARTYFLSWEGDDNQWLLMDYPGASNDSD
jgi:hypothetical protein